VAKSKGQTQISLVACFFVWYDKKRIKMSFSTKNTFGPLLAFAFGISLGLAGSVLAATTISTNVSTGGTLTVTGASTLMGNVGIGTTTPEASLDIDGTYPLVMRPRQTAGQGGVAAWIYYGQNAADYGELALYDYPAEYRMWSMGATSVNYPNLPNTFYIYQYRDQSHNSTARYALAINDSGYVGVGTTSPATNFAVAGNGYFSGMVNTSGKTGGYKVDGNLILQASSTNQSIAAGYQALAINTAAGTGNSAFGYQALASNQPLLDEFGDSSGGTSNSAFGYQALNANTYGLSNSAFGMYALQNNTTGDSNVGIGNEATGRNTTGDGNIGIGHGALFTNTTGSNNIAIGYGTAGQGAAGVFSGNSVVGSFAADELSTSGDFNSILGYRAGYRMTSGSNNIIIGAATSSSMIESGITTGSQNILIGTNIGMASSTLSGQLNIGNMIYGTDITGTGTTLSPGKIGIGTSSPATRLHVSSGAGATTTVTIGELGLTTSKSCVNMNRLDGNPASFYINAAGDGMVVEPNYCR